MSNVRNWKKHVVQCTNCRNLNRNIEHIDCPQGQKGSVVWLDLNNDELGCNKCNHVWPLKGNMCQCDYCGHFQPTDYVDTFMALESREYINDGYEA